MFDSTESTQEDITRNVGATEVQGENQGDAHPKNGPSLSPSFDDTCKRFYHVFREGELVELIEKHVDCLHVLESFYDHANWCVIAEKVHVWTI